MSEARGDTPEHIREQENAAGALIGHALCAGSRSTGPTTPSQLTSITVDGTTHAGQYGSTDQSERIRLGGTRPGCVPWRSGRARVAHPP